MARWRITHIAPTGRRHRLLVSAASITSAQNQAVLALGEPRALSCIRLTPSTTHTSTAAPCQSC